MRHDFGAVGVDASLHGRGVTGQALRPAAMELASVKYPPGIRVRQCRNRQLADCASLLF